MIKTCFAAVVMCVALALVTPASLWAGTPLEEGSRPDNALLAHRIVQQCAGVREGDQVLINGGVRDLELLEDMAVFTRSLGAFPLVTIGSDRMTLRMLENVPTKYLAQTPGIDLKLAETINVIVGVDFNDDASLLANIPADRLTTVGNAVQPVFDALLRRNVRQVNLGNGLYPTRDRARQFKMSQTELERVFWEAVDVDYTRMENTGDAVRSILSKGKRIHVINPNGTDLTVQIEGRQAFVSDGVISESDVRRGGAACQAWLPAGEVYMSVVPGTAEGKIVQDITFIQGKEITGLTLTVKGGKVTAMTATSGLEDLKRHYDAAGEGKDSFGFVDVGINPNIRIPQGSRMQAWMPAGMVTLGIGGNSWAGGENTSAFGLNLHLPGSTVTVDNTPVVERGTLVIGPQLTVIPVTTRSRDALQSWTTGLSLVDQLRFDDVRPQLEKAVAIDPDFAMAYYLLAMVAPTARERLDNSTRAMGLVEKVSEGERLLIEAQHAMMTGKESKGLDLLRKAVSLYPDDTRARFTLAVVYMNDNRYDDAVDELRTILRADPGFAPVQNMLGYCYMALGKFPEAERAFTRYIRLVPDEANPYDSYAELLMKEGRFDESITMYEKALSMNPRFYSAHVGVANNLTMKGLTVDARKRLQKLDDIAQTDSWRRIVLTGMARTYVAEGKYDKAVEELRERHAIAVKNKDDLSAANDLVLIGDVQLESSGVDPTKETYFKTRTPEPTKLNQANTTFTDALNTVSNSNLSQDIKDGVRLLYLSRQVEIAARNNDLATAKARTDEYRAAAVKRGIPVEMQTAHSLAAFVAIGEKRYQDAVNELKQSDPNDPKVLLRLAEAYDALGNTVSAQDVRNKITRMNDTSVSYTMIRRSITP